jgi:DNA polymerase
MGSSSVDLPKQYPGFNALRAIYEGYAYNCARCERCQVRTNSVFGYGQTETPPIAFIGGPPTPKDDLSSYPLSDSDGVMFDRMLKAMGYTRGDVYYCGSITCGSFLKMRVTSEHLDACWPLMASQLKAIRPKTIVAMGPLATLQLLRTRAPLEELRGRWHKWEGVPVRVTYSLSKLGVEPALKTAAWCDLKAVMAKLRAEV